MLKIRINYLADKSFDFPMKKNYINAQYENDCPIKSPKDSMWNVLIVRKGLK